MFSLRNYKEPKMKRIKNYLNKFKTKHHKLVSALHHALVGAGFASSSFAGWLSDSLHSLTLRVQGGCK